MCFGSIPIVEHGVLMMKSQFLDEVRADMRLRGYSIRTEHTYLTWIKRYINFTGQKHPREIGSEEMRAFLTRMAVKWEVSVNTQKVALNALAFLYNKHPGIELGDPAYLQAFVRHPHVAAGRGHQDSSGAAGPQ